MPAMYWELHHPQTMSLCLTPAEIEASVEKMWFSSFPPFIPFPPPLPLLPSFPSPSICLSFCLYTHLLTYSLTQSLSQISKLSATHTSRSTVQNPEVVFTPFSTTVPASLSSVPLNHHRPSAFLQSRHRPHVALTSILVLPLPVRPANYPQTQWQLRHLHGLFGCTHPQSKFKVHIDPLARHSIHHFSHTGGYLLDSSRSWVCISVYTE